VQRVSAETRTSLRPVGTTPSTHSFSAKIPTFRTAVLGHPAPYLPIPDPHIVSTPPPFPGQSAHEQLSQADSSVPSSTARTVHQPQPAPRAGVPGILPQNVPSTTPSKHSSSAASYQRGMLNTPTARMSQTPERSLSHYSLVLEVVFMALIFIGLAGAAWYRMNADFGRSPRTPPRRR
jgi:hypothetical protein